MQAPHLFFGFAHSHLPPGAVCSPQRVRMLGLPFAFWTAMHLSAPRGPTAVQLWCFFLPMEKQMAFFLQALGFSGVHSVSTKIP